MLTSVALPLKRLRLTAGRYATECHRRWFYKLATGVSFCAKGPLSGLNRDNGDDAFVNTSWTRKGPHRGATLLGVADGVGGWHNYNVDPSRLSSGLCSAMSERFASMDTPTAELFDTVHEISDAFWNLAEKGDRFAGGTTICIGYYDPVKARLTVANLGDSRMVLIRDRQVTAMSQAQFEGMAPHQLVIPPQWMVDKFKEKCQKQGKMEDSGPPWMENELSQLQTYNFELRPKDVLIFGTDGLFDNLYPTTIEEITVKSLTNILASPAPAVPTSDQVARLAQTLVEGAYYNSMDPNFASPFAINALEYNKVYMGGKLDDITVVAAVVYDEPKQELSLSAEQPSAAPS